VLPGEVKVRATDLEQLRAFRAALHRLVTPGAAEPEEEALGAAPAAPGAQLGEAKASGALAPVPEAPVSVAAAWSVGAELVLEADGTVELRPGGSGAEYMISRVLAEVLGGQQLDTWRRLKACRNPRCRVVFYDRSRNNSGVWHSLKTCGNPANLRAFRARNKEVSS
jgi:predicted RNA-binding Zn ribbon-like protein